MINQCCFRYLVTKLYEIQMNSYQKCSLSAKASGWLKDVRGGDYRSYSFSYCLD